MNRPRVLIAASEAAPFASVGGLAEVASGLTRALAELGADARLILPRYGGLRHSEKLTWKADLGSIPLEVYSFRASLWEARLPASPAPVYFVENPDYFSRPGVYSDPATGVEYGDNFQRYLFFMKAVLRACHSLEWFPDVLHCNDWQTALLPAYLRFARAGSADWRDTASLFTIHNLAYQGQFHPSGFKLTDLPRELAVPGGPIEHRGHLSFMKAGIECADGITTVSPTYAREIQSGADQGAGLEEVLRRRHADLFGVLNGIDTVEWNPETDPLIPERYGASRLDGKARCKAELQRRTGLPVDPGVPLVGMVTRLVAQKGIDLLVEALPEMAALGTQWILLGEGERGYHDAIRAAALSRPDRIHVHFGFDTALAHTIQSGSDLLLMPSRYEPCGLTQMHALRYGTVPLVRRTGGLADTVRDAHQTADGNGFQFCSYSARELVESLKRALWTFHQPSLWQQIMRRGMSEDFSWSRSARRYLELYHRVEARL